MIEDNRTSPTPPVYQCPPFLDCWQGLLPLENLCWRMHFCLFSVSSRLFSLVHFLNRSLSDMKHLFFNLFFFDKSLLSGYCIRIRPRLHLTCPLSGRRFLLSPP